MAISRIRPIDDLYADVADFDLVIAPDVSLASALNRRIDTPHFGHFAITPRRLVHRRRERPEARQAFLEVIRHTELDWKAAAVAIEEVMQCWEHEGAPEAILAYDGFDTPAVREILRIHGDLDITPRALGEYSIDRERYETVAAIEPALLTTLQRSILPDDVTAIELFTGEAFEPPEFCIFETPAAVIDAVMDQLTPQNADQFGIVLEDDSEYSTLLESALETAGIPFYGGPGFTDDGDLRAFLACLRAAFAGTDTRVGDIRPFLTRVGSVVDVAHDEKRLFEIDDPSLDWIKEFCTSCRTGTLEKALAAFETRLGRRLERLRGEFTTLGVLEEPLTEALLNRVIFYLESYEIPVERENAGVLLADATSAAYVDRPMVLCLGLDDGWTHTSPRRPWIDRDRAFDRNLRNFELVLQSGAGRRYFVVDAAGGRAVTPTIYLEELLDAEFERFRDLPSATYTGRSTATGRAFDREPTDIASTPDPVEAVSQSSLNTFVASPRDYLFGQLVDGPEQVHLEEGTLFHDFAEFYLAHPTYVEDEDGTIDPARLRTLAELMLERVRPFLPDAAREARLTRYVVGFQTIVQFIRTHAFDPPGVETDLEQADWNTNAFADHFGLEIDAATTELWFEDVDLGLRGLIDLLAAEDHLVDFKSGSKQTAGALARASELDPPTDEPNFQAMVYLSVLRDRRPNRELRFSFVHFLETADEVLTGRPDLTDCITELRYLPVTYEEYLGSREAYDGLCEDAAKDCNKTFGQIDLDTWLDILDEVDVPKTRNKAELLDSPFNAYLTAALEAAVGPYKYVEKGCAQACRYLVDLRLHNVFADDLDAFEAFVDERIEVLNAYLRGAARFPVAGPGGEPNWRRIDHRDMLLEGEIGPEERRPT